MRCFNCDNSENDPEASCFDATERVSVIETTDYDDVEIINTSTLSHRAKNLLMRNGIFTIKELKTSIQAGEFESLKNLGKKTRTEIYDLLGCNIINLSHPALSTTAKKELTISRAFSENAYNLFVKYCEANGFNLFSDLIGFDFDSLIYEKGFGTGRIEKLKIKYKEILECIDDLDVEEADDKTKSNVSFLIHNSNRKLPISILLDLDVSRKSIAGLYNLNIRTIKDLSETLLSETRKIELLKRIGKKKLDQLFDVVQEFEVPLNDICKKVFEKMRTERNFEVYIKRVAGSTLQEIADMYSMTRERVRQIEKKFNDRIKPLILTLITNYLLENSKNYIRMQTVLNMFGDDNLDKVVLHILNNCDELEYLDFAEIYVVKTSKNQNTFLKLREIAIELIGDGINLYEKLDKLDAMLANKGYSYIDADAFLNFLIACNAKFYGDYVVFDKQSYGYLCAKVVGKYFKDGISLYSEDDLSLLREYVKKEFGTLKLPENNRALASRVEQFLVIVDKGKYNVIENITVDLDVLEEIKKFIDTNIHNKLYYSEIFSEFEGLLCMTTGITNHYCLHGVLSYYYPDNYSYSRCFLTKSGCEYISISIDERINEILKAADHALSKKEIKNKLSGYSDAVIFNACYRSKSLIQWDANYYNTMDNIVFEGNECNKLGIILEMMVNKNDGYCSDRQVYEEVANQLSEFCIRNHIENHTNLFYILANLFSSKYKFSQPHIAEHHLFNDLTTKNVAIYFLKDVDHISYSEFVAIAEKMHWPHVTVGIVFSELETDYFRISQDEYIKKDLVTISTQCIDNIKAIILSKMNDIGYLSLIGLDDFEDFCDVGYKLNSFLIASIVEHFNMGFKIIQPQVRDRRYQKGIIVPRDFHINSYDEIVVATMKYHNIESLGESQFLSFLILNRLVRKAIPKELQLSEIIKYENETYSV